MKINQRKYIFFVEGYWEKYEQCICVNKENKTLLLFTYSDKSCAQLYQMDSGLEHVIHWCLFKAAASSKIDSSWLVLNIQEYRETFFTLSSDIGIEYNFLVM